MFNVFLIEIKFLLYWIREKNIKWLLNDKIVFSTTESFKKIFLLSFKSPKKVINYEENKQKINEFLKRNEYYQNNKKSKIQ